MSGKETKSVVYHSTQNKYLVNIRSVMVIIQKGTRDKWVYQIADSKMVFIYGCTQSLLLCGLSLVVVHRLLIVVASLAALVVVERLSCPAASGILLDQGLNQCPSAWAGIFLTTRPPSKSQKWFLEKVLCFCLDLRDWDVFLTLVNSKNSQSFASSVKWESNNP